MNSFLKAALEYAERGWLVFPCQHHAKRPVYLGSWKLATTNPATVRRIFGGSIEHNIAVRTGLASGIWVLDIDDRHDGFVTLAELEHRHGRLPATRRCKTANGVHFYWRTEIPIESGTGRIGSGLDTQGESRYIIAPPSVHPNGVIYTWENDEPLAAAPDWLVKLTRKAPPPPIKLPPRACQGAPGAYGAAALRREINALEGAPRGTRNCALNRASFSLHQLVAGGELDSPSALHGLLGAAERNGLLADDGPRQVMATIQSGARAGLAHPRRRP
jgi:hypothetical protein